MAEAVIADRGVIVVELFDPGYSRRVPWERWSEEVALLEQARLADRRFDAVVVAEFGRAFADRRPPTSQAEPASQRRPGAAFVDMTTAVARRVGHVEVG
jgi:hypothetical protein